MIAVIEKTSFWKSLPQSSDSREETVQVKRPSQQWNIDGMRVVRCNVINMAAPSPEV